MDVTVEKAYPTPFVNSTLLPMLLLSLAQQKPSPETAKAIKTEYDYVIVGAGSAGSVVASRLSEIPYVSVLLLEAGKPAPMLTDVPSLARFFRFTDIDWQYRTAPQRHTGESLSGRQVVWPSGKTIGGSSVLNSNVAVRGNGRDYDQWAEEGADGWSYQDVLPYFKKMEDNRDPEYFANGFHSVGGPVTIHRPRYQAEYKDPLFRTADAQKYKVIDPNGNQQTGFYDVQGNLRAGQRCSTAKAYLVPAENRTNLDILPNAMVRKVVIEKRKAVGVEFDFQGTTYVVEALREVIMSAGAINTPQLLMLSGIGPREELQRLKIPVIADVPVGRNLQDHPATFLNFLFRSDVRPVTEKLADPSNIMQYIQNRTGPLASTDFISALAFLNSREYAPEEDYPDHELYFQEAEAEGALQIGLRPEVFDQVYGPLEGKSFYLCVSSLLHPRSRGTVTLNSSDPYDPPIIDPNYFEDPEDMKVVVEGLKTCMLFGNDRIMQEAGSTISDILFPGCEKYAENEERYFTCLARNMIVTSGHPVGTARMGNPKDLNTVVDPQLRVLNIEGLRVVDASVMPLIPSGSTNLPTIMVAEKASDIIKSTIECTDDTDDEWNKEESNWSEDTQQPPQPNSDYYDDGQDWKEEKKSFWSKPQPYPTHPDQFETPLKIKNQNTWQKDINHWIDMPQRPVQKDPHVIPWNQEMLTTVGKFPATENAMKTNGNQNFPVSDDEEEEQEEFSNDSPPSSYNGNKISDEHQTYTSHGMADRPQIGYTPPPSNIQSTRPQAPTSQLQTPQNRPQMQMTTTQMPPKSPPTGTPTTVGNNRPMPGRGKNITIHIQKPQSQINKFSSQIKNKIQVILEQLLMPNSPPNPMQSSKPTNNTQSSMPSYPMQPNMPSNPMQPNMPSNPMQPNMPSNPMQPNMPSNPMQSNPPSNPMQPNRPSNNPMPSSGSNMRPSEVPNILEELMKLEQMSSCEKEFCNSLLNYIDCQQQACQKRAQFALYIFNILCPSFTNKSTVY